jgi:hypothetical protein
VAIGESWTENYGLGGIRDGANIPFTVATDHAAVFFLYDPDSHAVTISDKPIRGSLRFARAQWVSRDTIAWNVPDGATSTFKLHHSPTGGLVLTPTAVTGGVDLPLTFDPAGLSPRFWPVLSVGLRGLQGGSVMPVQVPAILKEALAVQPGQRRPDGCDVAADPGLLTILRTTVRWGRR